MRHQFELQLLLFQPSSLLMAGEGSLGCSVALGSGTHIANLEEVPGFQLHIGSTLSMVTIWDVNPQMKNLCPSLSLSVTLMSM